MNGPAGLQERTRPRLNIGDIPIADAIELQIIHAPGREQLRPRIDKLLRSGTGVVDVIHRSPEVRHLGPARHGNIGGMKRGSFDRSVCRHGELGNSRCDIEAEFETKTMDIGAKSRHAPGELVGIGNPSAKRIDRRVRVCVPTSIDDDVQISGRFEGRRLYLSDRLDRILIDVCLETAPAAPTERRRQRQAVGGGMRAAADAEEESCTHTRSDSACMVADETADHGGQADHSRLTERPSFETVCGRWHKKSAPSQSLL